MYVKHVRILNWMAYAGLHDIGPLPPGPIAVVGRYEENTRRSNWSGKTAFLEAIRFALTGAHRKRLDDSLIHGVGDRMEVEVVMSTGLLVRRTRPRRGPTVLCVIDEEHTFERDAAETHLAEVLRLPVEDFDQTSWFGQGDVQALCAKTSGVRREVFARWLELDLWERMGATAGREAREARAVLENARRATLGDAPRDVAVIRADLLALDERIAGLNSERTAVDGRLSKLGILTTIATRSHDLEAATQALRGIRTQLAALPPVADAAATDAAREAWGRERAALSAAEREIAEVRALLGGNFDGQCPVTCEACPVAGEVSGKRASFVERGRLAGIRRDEARAGTVTEHAIITTAEGHARERASLVGRFTDATTRVRAARAQLDEITKAAEADGITNEPGLVDNLRVSRSLLDTKLGEARQELGRGQEELRYAGTYAARSVAREEEIAKAERGARVAQLVARGLGGSGIAAKIAAASLSGLEARANALLAGQGLSFVLTWERELSDPAPACAECGHVYEKRTRARECPSCGALRSRKKSDEVDVLVDDGSGEIEDVRTKSGGAKVLVASAIRLAGGMMLRERRGSPLEVAFIDEPFGELDGENRDALARTFSGLLSSVGLEQAFVVSHDAQLLSGLPARVVVTREGSTSRLTLET